MTTNFSTVSCEEFLQAAREFVSTSNKICDRWKLVEEEGAIHKAYLKKEAYMQHGSILLKAEYVIFYQLSYGVPSFSFNVWNSSGTLVSLDEVRKMAFIQINEKEFYSVVTQQEHPILRRPYFIVHPCHTDILLAEFKNRTKNIIVTFLGLITPLIRINLPLEYAH